MGNTNHLKIKHISLSEANAYVEEHHRHHPKVQGHKYSIACYKNGILCGVAITGHPQSRHLDDGDTLEVLRLCTDGTQNACSILYGRCARIGKDMGYKKIITYILESESGHSLMASGWNLEAVGVGGVDWNNCQRSKDRENNKQLSFIEQKVVPKELKQRWSKILNEES